MLKKYLPLISGLAYSTIFGFSFMFTKSIVAEIDPIHLLAFRFAIAAISLTIIWLLGIIKINYKNKNIKILLILCITQPILYFIFETVGISKTTSSEAGLMISLIPVAVTIIASIFLKERPSKKQLVFIVFSVIGVIFIIVMKGKLDVKSNFTGMILLGGAVLSAAFYNILSRKISISFNPLEITFGMMWAGAIFFNLIAIISFDNSWKAYFNPLTKMNILIPLSYLGVLSSVAAFFLLNFTLSRIKSFQSAVFANLVTVISIIAGVVFLNEPFYWFQIVGAVMIIIGVWGTNYFGELERPVEEITS